MAVTTMQRLSIIPAGMNFFVLASLIPNTTIKSPVTTDPVIMPVVGFVSVTAKAIASNTELITPAINEALLLAWV